MRKSLKGTLPSGLPPDPRDPAIAEILARAERNALMDIASNFAWRLSQTPEGLRLVQQVLDVAIDEASEDWDPFPVNAKGDRQPASWVFAKPGELRHDEWPIARTDAIRVMVVKAIRRHFAQLRAQFPDEPIGPTEPDDGQ